MELWSKCTYLTRTVQELIAFNNHILSKTIAKYQKIDAIKVAKYADQQLAVDIDKS